MFCLLVFDALRKLVARYAELFKCSLNYYHSDTTHLVGHCLKISIYFEKILEKKVFESNLYFVVVELTIPLGGGDEFGTRS